MRYLIPSQPYAHPQALVNAGLNVPPAETEPAGNLRGLWDAAGLTPALK
jgi:hypothetical protein